jgi:glycosyltransferase involved in cell wall biosynthesis
MTFSIIIPLYNKQCYIAKAIESVLSQSFTDYELIVVDDGSKDESFEVANSIIGNRGNCHLYRQQNAGVSVARNNGVALSRGKYLCFLDADDWWEPTFLEEMSKLVKEFPGAGIYGANYTIVNETRHKTRIAPIGVDPGFEKGYIDYCQVYAKTLAMPLWTGAVCIPRPVFDEMKGFPKGIKLGEDFLLWIRIALQYKVVFLNKPLSYYNQDVDAANRGVGKLHSPEYHMLWNLGFLEKEEMENPDFKQLVDNLRTYGLFPYYLSKDYHEAAKEELEKVDWNRQPEKRKKQYRQPLFWVRMKYSIGVLGVALKQYLLRVI